MTLIGGLICITVTSPLHVCPWAICCGGGGTLLSDIASVRKDFQIEVGVYKRGIFHVHVYVVYPIAYADAFTMNLLYESPTHERATCLKSRAI